MPRVLISAGHTLRDPGDVSGELREADLTRKIASKLVPKLKSDGLLAMQVPLDLQLLQRIDWINNTGYRASLGDICIELHIGSGGKRGVKSWYSGSKQNPGYKLANHLVTHLNSVGNYRNNGAHPETEHELKQLAILNRTKPITVMLECLYLDNQEDAKILKNDKKLEKFAGEIATGVKEYLDQNPSPKNKPQKPISQSDNQPNRASNVPTTPSPQPNPGRFGSIPNTGSTGNLMQERENRKQMIIDKYVQILGREPSESDKNYFLNIGITEDQLVKRMLESQEHVDMIKSRQELKDIKKELTKLKSASRSHQAKAEESEKMITHLRKLIDQYKHQIQSMQQQLANHGVTPEQYLPQTITSSQSPPPPPQYTEQSNTPAMAPNFDPNQVPDKSLLQKILDMFK